MKKLLLICGLLWSALASAQFVPGQVLTAAELNSQFALYAPLTGATFTGPLVSPSITSTSTTQGRLDNTTSLATDAFVNQQGASAVATVPFAGVTGGTYNQATQGSGAQIVVFASGGVVTSSLTISNPGTGYAVGDLLALPSGNSDAVLRVTGVSGGGVTSVGIAYGGSGYTTGNQVTAQAVPPGRRAVVFTGTLTSNLTFIIQNGTFLTASREVEFINNTTGAFTITVKLSNGAGGSTGTGIVLPQGSNNSTAVSVYTDGVNDVWLANSPAGIGNGTMAAQNANAVAITGGTITGLSAPIPLGSGGTGAATATGATSNLQYMQGATGSAARSVSSKLGDTISTGDFSGCDPTNTTDSTACLQNAITAASGKNLYILPGTYKVTSLTVPNSINIYGDGPGAVTLNETLATGDTISVSASQVVISGLSFTTATTRTAGAFVNFQASSQQVTLRDFYMNGQYIGVHMTASSAGRVQFGYMFGGATSAGSTGILVDGGNDQYINQVTMDAPSGAQPASGIQVTSTGALNLTDDDIIHHGQDLLINPGNGQTVASLWVEDSYFDTAANGIVFSATGTGNIVRCRFLGTWTSSHTGAGVYINPPGTGNEDGIEFIGHHAFNNSTNGVVLNGGINVRFLGGAIAGTTAGSGISVAAGVSNWSVEGTLIGAGFGFAGNAYGVYINSGSSNNFKLTNNTITGNTTANVVNGASGAAFTITGNFGVADATSNIFTASNGITNSPISGSTGSFTTLTASSNDALFYQDNNAQSIPNGTATTVTTWTKISDRVNANFNAATGVFTAPVTGQYWASANLTYAVTTGGSGIVQDVRIVGNGVTLCHNQLAVGVTTTVPESVSTSCLVSLTAGQTIVVQAFQNSGSAVALAVGSAFNNTVSIARLP